MSDREPMPGDGPDYHADHAAWLGRQQRGHRPICADCGNRWPCPWSDERRENQ